MVHYVKMQVFTVSKIGVGDEIFAESLYTRPWGGTGTVSQFWARRHSVYFLPPSRVYEDGGFAKWNSREVRIRFLEFIHFVPELLVPERQKPNMCGLAVFRQSRIELPKTTGVLVTGRRNVPVPILMEAL